MSRRRLLQALLLGLVWAVTSVAVGTVLFLTSSRTVVLASHDSVVRPTLDGQVTVHTGPVLPDFRVASGHRVGVDVELGKTTASSLSELVQRYGLIAGSPDGTIEKLTDAVRRMLVDAAVRGAALGLLPVGLWVLVGPVRRRELWRRTRSRQGVVVVTAVAVVAVALWEPWQQEDPTQRPTWLRLSAVLGSDVRLPQELAGVQVRSGLSDAQSRRLVETAVSTYRQSLRFYASARERAAGLDLRQPRPNETVVLFVSDRHDNIGMDPVARAIGDRGGATAVFDGGDDTSTGATWEAFSLDSVSAAFRDLDRWSVTGNHDNGSFVGDYLADHGWTVLHGQVVDGPGGTTLLGAADPRASGFADYKAKSGASLEEVGHELADTACAQRSRVTTLLVHDASVGREALERGCVELVLGGHLHVRVGPTRVIGPHGEVGRSYTTGTTGGAVYAIATGSKPRRDAGITLITYRDGHPVGLQYVVLQTNGHYIVEHYEELR